VVGFIVLGAGVVAGRAVLDVVGHTLRAPSRRGRTGTAERPAETPPSGGR
jgi:hypothetical protein